jgi:hypothetical protein
MQKQETQRLVLKVCAVDGRQPTEQTFIAWHELIGHLSAEVASMALQMAMSDERVNKVEPRHVLARVPDATGKLNAQLRDEPEEQFDPRIHVGPPKNMREMEEFYSKLWKANPWPTYKWSGAYTAKGNRHEIPIMGDELHRIIKEKADEMGWEIPVPRWDDVKELENVPF